MTFATLVYGVYGNSNFWNVSNPHAKPKQSSLKVNLHTLYHILFQTSKNEALNVGAIVSNIESQGLGQQPRLEVKL